MKQYNPQSNPNFTNTQNLNPKTKIKTEIFQKLTVREIENCWETEIYLESLRVRMNERERARPRLDRVLKYIGSIVTQNR